jgi:hypothetical protein
MHWVKNWGDASGVFDVPGVRKDASTAGLSRGSERRWRSAASSGSPCGLDVLHGGNVVWTTAGALLGSLNAGKHVGVDAFVI